MKAARYSDYRDRLIETARTDHYIAAQAKMPITINWRGHPLQFKEIVFASDTETLIGGTLVHESSVQIGQNQYPITEIDFYRDDELDADSVELARNVTVYVGARALEFENTRTTAGLSFHPNGSVMSGKLATPIAIEVGGNTYTFSSIGFFEDGRVSGGKPTSNTTIIEGASELVIEGAEQEYFDGYTVSFTTDGQIDWAYLVNGTTYRRGA